LTLRDPSLRTVYVACAESGEVNLLRLAPAAATLSHVQTVAVGGIAMPMAVSADRRRLHVARRSEPLAVVTFAIDADKGTLTLLGEAPLPHSMAHIALDGSGRFLFAASYGGHLVSVSPVDASGRPGQAQQVIAGIPNAHALRTDPGNRFAFAPSLGSDRVLQFRFDAASGRLEPHELPAFATRQGAGPRHIVFHPRLPVAYLLSELDGGIDRLGCDPRQGTLAWQQTVSTLPPDFSGAPWAAELRLTPDARFLYASERRSSTLSGFAVHPDSGELTPCGHWNSQAEPRGFAIDPTGAFLVAAGQASNRVTLHRIDRHSGALAAISELAVGAGPNWVEII
jgi:6-phosphogluconolactonase